MHCNARSLAGLVVFQTLAACSDDTTLTPTPDDACADFAEETPSATIGTGAVTFERLRDGDELPVIWGGQGGIHVWGSVRVKGIHPGPRGVDVDSTSPNVEFIVRAEGRRINFSNAAPRNFRIRQNGTVEIVGEAVVLVSPATSIDRSVTFSVRVDDVCGTRVSDARDVAIVDPAT